MKQVARKAALKRMARKAPAKKTRNPVATATRNHAAAVKALAIAQKTYDRAVAAEKAAAARLDAMIAKKEANTGKAAPKAAEANIEPTANEGETSDLPGQLTE